MPITPCANGRASTAPAAITPGVCRARSRIASTCAHCFSLEPSEIRTADVEREDVPGIEAEIEPQQRDEAAREQARSREQHQRGRELRRDQKFSGPGRGRSRRPALRSLMQAGHEAGGAVLPGREQADDHRRSDADAEREEQRSGVDRGVLEPGHVDRRQPDDRVEHRVAEPDADRAGQQRQQDRSHSSWRTICQRRAPSANRTATSRRRDAFCTSSSPVALAHAMSSSTAAAPPIASNAGRAGPSRCVSSGVATTTIEVSGSGLASTSRAMVESSATTFSRAAPSVSRPTA